MIAQGEVWRYLFLFCGIAFAFSWARHAMGWRRLRRSRRVSQAGFDAEAAPAAPLEALERRVLELEERLDFTERMLASRSEAGH